MFEFVVELVEKAQDLGLPSWLANEIIILIALGGMILSFSSYANKLINTFREKRKAKLLSQNLAPFFYPDEILKAVRFFIPTRGQYVSPTKTYEERKEDKKINSFKLIPKILERFKLSNALDKSASQYLIILADSGMGKSTFMLNLYDAFHKQNKLDKYTNIHLFPLGHPDTIEAIKAIEDKKTSILLLDALDEDIQAIENYEQRMEMLIEATKPFWKVILTCRTQFFPSEVEEPEKTGLLKYGPGGGEIRFDKIYISIFNRRDVWRYLIKRFNIINPFNWSKIIRGYKIVNSNPDLVFRPMILSFIQDLITEKQEYNYNFEMYEIIIRKWIEREANKPFIQKNYSDVSVFEKALYQFSKDMAINIFQNRLSRGGLFVDKDDPVLQGNVIQALGLNAANGDDGNSGKRTRSLLNRNAQGHYKFAHRSILEYFLALEAVENPKFFQESTTDKDAFEFVNDFLVEMEFAAQSMHIQ